MKDKQKPHSHATQPQVREDRIKQKTTKQNDRPRYNFDPCVLDTFFMSEARRKELIAQYGLEAVRRGEVW